MANRYGAVFVQKKHCLRLADNVAAPDNNTFLSAYFNPRQMNQLHNTGRRAGKKIVIADHYFAHIDGMKCVNILAVVNCKQHLFTVNSFRQRKLNQNPVYVAAFVKRIYQRKQFFLGCAFGKSVLLGIDSANLAGFFLVVDINSACRVVSDDDDGKSGFNAFFLYFLC